MQSKSDTPFARIDTNPAYTSPNSPTYAATKRINGFDTETADGSIFMLSYAFADRDPQVLDADGQTLDNERLWGILTHEQARSAINVWYNLNFDANVFLSHVLDNEEMAKLVTLGSVTTKDGYDITYVPSKFLSISDQNDNTYKHFDVSQFFYAPLDVAADEWLGESKTDGIDTKRFGAPDDEDAEHDVNDYILSNWFDIRTYARKDAALVRDLWKEAVKVGESIDPEPIPMGAPYSTGYLAESFLNAYFGEDGKPGIGPTSMAAHAWKAYAGGRFEIYERGDVGNVAGPDINSAYPWVLSELPDPATLTWEKKWNPSLEELRDADYGFVTATVETDEGRRIQPFAVKDPDDGVVKYPALSGRRVDTLRETFLFACDAGYVETFHVHSAWLGYESNATQYPFRFVDDLYDRRKSFESDGRVKTAQLIKIVLNSMYGKTCQTTPKRRELSTDGATELRREEQFVSPRSMPEPVRDTFRNGLVERLQSGSWFNPFLAAYITGRTRLELHKRTVEYGLEESTVMFATDCVMYDRDAYERSGFADDLVKPGLGGWDYDYAGRAFVIGAGIYEVETSDGGMKTQTRGFKEAQLHGEDCPVSNGGGTCDCGGGLRNACIDADAEIRIESTRPKTAAEAVWSGAPLAEVGQFVTTDRTLRADMDSKRQWPDTKGFQNLIGNCQTGAPLIFGTRN